MFKGIVFDLEIFDSLGISKFIEFVKFHKWLYLFGLFVSDVHQKKVREFYYGQTFSEDGLNMKTDICYLMECLKCYFYGL